VTDSDSVWHSAKIAVQKLLILMKEKGNENEKWNGKWNEEIIKS
jgi:hypothetical protein